MANAFFNPPTPVNEPVLSYLPNSAERKSVKAQLAEYKATETEVEMVIGGKKVSSKDRVEIRAPHERKHLLGHFHRGGAVEVNAAIEAAGKAHKDWANASWEHRAAVFLKAADLLAGKYRAKMNASTMLAQSKNIYQAEIDAACEMADFFRFNATYMQQIYQDQPISGAGIWNRVEHRGLEGFVFAVTPFNFTSICANLAAAPAMMGNTVVWKPSDTQAYSAKIIMDLFAEAGLPDGVINMVLADGPVAGQAALSHPDFAGLHFTGSTATFQHLWREIGNNIGQYRSYPRIVGETGGKDFVVAHGSADPKAVAVGLARGAFEYQGQKCSAASRAYVAKSIWADVEKNLVADLASMKMGTVEDFGNFINAVIDERAFDKITAYIAAAKADKNVKIIAGGNYSKAEGFFIEPTVIVVKDPKYRTMCEEIFGPVLTIYVFDDKKWDETLTLVDSSSPYALTGAVFATDRHVIAQAEARLRYAAGNFYINDKPTGAVVGQQPFGGGRASGTNDKAGSPLNLLRWVSPRTIKETFSPPTDYRYPFLQEA
jgi:1-pyrroline-5-carboxylate dehydrogenase